MWAQQLVMFIHWVNHFMFRVHRTGQCEEQWSNKAINIALQCIALCPLENKALPKTLRYFSHFPLFCAIRAVNEATNET